MKYEDPAKCSVIGDGFLTLNKISITNLENIVQDKSSARSNFYVVILDILYGELGRKS